MCTPAPVWRSKDNSTESVLLFHLDMHPRDGTQVVQLGGRYLPQQGHFTGFWGWNSAASKSTGCQLVAILYSFRILVWIGSFDLWKLELSTRQCLYFTKRWKWGSGASDLHLWVLARTRHPCAIPQPTPLRVGCPQSGSVCNCTLCKALASAPNLTPVSAKSARKD